MNSKACLLVFGFLLIFVILACAGEENNDNNLSAESEASRVVRDADPKKRQKEKNQGRKKRKNKKASKKKSQKGKNKRKIKAGRRSKKASKKKSKKGKSKRKNKAGRRSKKASKKKSKKGKSKRKNKAGRRSKKGNKSGQVKRRQQKKKKKSSRPRKSEKITGRTVDGKCLETAVKAMRKLEKVVANFGKQMIRVEKQAGIASKKGQKKAVFGPIALRLIDVGGGNKSALTCAGSADSDGAKQLKNLTDTLMMCEMEVNKTCSMGLPKPNATLIKECNTSTKAFRKMAEECFAKSKEDTASDACTCWTNANLTKAGDSVAACNIKEVGDVAKGLKKCKEAFAKCRQFEDDAVSTISLCSKSTDMLKKKAAQLKANKDAVTAAIAKIKEATGSRRARVARKAAKTCAEFTVLVVQLVTVATNFAASPKVVVISGYIVSSSFTACTEDEKTALKVQKAKVDEIAKVIEEMFDDAQDALQEATGSTLSSSDLDAVQTGTSTKAARLRNRDRLQQFMNKA